MQQAPQPRSRDLFGAFRPQHCCGHIAPDGALRLGQIDEQGQALAQGQVARLVVPTDLRKSKRPHGEPSHSDPTSNDGVRGRSRDAAMLPPRQSIVAEISGDGLSAGAAWLSSVRSATRGHRGPRTDTWENS